MPAPVNLVLASASPRRQELLQAMGVEFSIVPADIDETLNSQQSATEFVSRLAESKAKACAEALGSTQNHAILSADTIVSQGETIFGKPANEAEAMEMWRQLSDNHHQVATAVSLFARDRIDTTIVTTNVLFAEISEEQMSAYWLSGEPQDKAGGYAIQGLASAWVKLIHGSYSNVVGLPLRETNELLKRVNLNWL